MPERDALDWDSNRSSNFLINNRLQTIVSNPLLLKSRRMRWLYKRLAHNYIQAGVLTPYTIKLSTILRDSGTHQSERGKDNRKRVEEALEELQEKRVLIRYEAEILRGKRAKVIDAKYVL